jgi:hypothetical protein
MHSFDLITIFLLPAVGILGYLKSRKGRRDKRHTDKLLGGGEQKWEGCICLFVLLFARYDNVIGWKEMTVNWY